MIRPSRRIRRFLITRADAARDEKRYEAAAALYKEALELAPNAAGIHIQRGHMLKETGKFALAEQHYDEAHRLTPDDADLALQRGHFYKVAGRLREAHEAYELASRLKPGWNDPVRELSHLHEHGWQGSGAAATGDPLPIPSSRATAFGNRSIAEIVRLVPELAPRPPQDLLRTYEERIDVSRFGRWELGYWGKRRTLRGIEAARGFCISAVPIVEVQLLLNGILFHRGMPTDGHPLKLDVEQGRLKKYVFNLWVDFTSFAQGLHAIEIRFFDVNDQSRSHREDIVVAAPQCEKDYPKSHLPVEISYDDKRSLEEQIRTRPSMVHSAKRALFPDGVHNVLVMRMDQLGGYGSVDTSAPATQGACAGRQSGGSVQPGQR